MQTIDFITYTNKPDAVAKWQIIDSGCDSYIPQFATLDEAQFYLYCDYCLMVDSYGDEGINLYTFEKLSEKKLARQKGYTFSPVEDPARVYSITIERIAQ